MVCRVDRGGMNIHIWIQYQIKIFESQKYYAIWFHIILHVFSFCVCTNPSTLAWIASPTHYKMRDRILAYLLLFQEILCLIMHSLPNIPYLKYFILYIIVTIILPLYKTSAHFISWAALFHTYHIRSILVSITIFTILLLVQLLYKFKLTSVGEKVTHSPRA